jgi:NTP pyrophosphohydrolases including oxidative damage repair enzymes
MSDPNYSLDPPPLNHLHKLLDRADLPGRRAQIKMSPVKEQEEEKYYKPDASSRKAAVLALLIPDLKKGFEYPSLTFIRRPAHPKDQHSGQIGFPGGGLEDQDKSYAECALRETFEEIGVPQRKIHLLGALTPLYVYASNNLVYPYVGYTLDHPEFVLQESEVAEVITCPVQHFNEPSAIKYKDLKVRGVQLNQVPYFDLYGHVLWGATAMMVSEFIHLWNKSI